MHARGTPRFVSRDEGVDIVENRGLSWSSPEPRFRVGLADSLKLSGGSQLLTSPHLGSRQHTTATITTERIQDINVGLSMIVKCVYCIIRLCICKSFNQKPLVYGLICLPRSERSTSKNKLPNPSSSTA